jgi:hypothetical protein
MRRTPGQNSRILYVEFDIYRESPVAAPFTPVIGKPANGGSERREQGFAA